MDAKNQVRIQEHGGMNIRELRDLGMNQESILDFSVNINPFGSSPGVLRALRTFDPAIYPDREVIDLRSQLASLNQTTVEEVLVGNGTADLIWLVAWAFLKGREALILAPTFGEYSRAAKAVGAQVHSLWTVDGDFHFRLEPILKEIQRLCPAVTFLCNPNNPTGTWLEDKQVQSIAEACQPGLLVLDEAYRSFVTLNPFAPPHLKNVIILRSMTKDFALAGLRLGYVLADAGWIDTLKAIQPAWNVNGAAQVCGLAALSDLPIVSDNLERTRLAAQKLHNQLRQSGAAVIPSATQFCLVDVSPVSGAALRHDLLLKGIQVRDCASFGLPNFVRIGTRTSQENQKLVEVWSGK